MLAKGDLDGIEDFDKYDDEKNSVEQEHDVVSQSSGGHIFAEVQNLGNEKGNGNGY
jgi:hypothetical protein